MARSAGVSAFGTPPRVGEEEEVGGVEVGSSWAPVTLGTGLPDEEIPMMTPRLSGGVVDGGVEPGRLVAPALDKPPMSPDDISSAADDENP